MSNLRREQLSEDQYSPLDAGWDACLEGRRSSDNPYSITNWKHYDWQQGWDLAAASDPPDSVLGSTPGSAPSRLASEPIKCHPHRG
ncbi:MAG: hypothetical protein ACI9W6_002022 [Motiliproteus sp.]